MPIIRLPAKQLCALQIVVPLDEESGKGANGPHMTLQAFFPPMYPSSQPPLAQLSAPHLPEDVTTWAVNQLEQQFRAGKALFDCLRQVSMKAAFSAMTDENLCLGFMQ